MMNIPLRVCANSFLFYSWNDKVNYHNKDKTA